MRVTEHLFFRRPRSRGATALAALLLTAALALLAGCGSSGGANSLTLYSGQHVQTTAALVQAFEKQTGITVNTRSNDEDTLAAQISTEGSNSPADVFYTENSPPLAYLQSKNLLSPVAPSTLAKVPARYSSSQGHWVGVSARVSVLIYNPSKISASQLPASVMQLADATYKGKLALAPSETDFQPIVTSVAKADGDQAAVNWLKGLAANAGSRIYPDNETVVNEVNNGSAAIGIINQYYWYRIRDEIGASNMHAKIAFLAPRDVGYVIDVSGAGILKSSSHQANAQRFLAFLVSPQAQQIIAHSESYEYPLLPGVAASSKEVPLSQLQPNPITVADLGDGASAVALLRQAGLL
jgi:iron(III) transport system substrate-binding protein